MTSKERLLTTLNHKIPDKIPWWCLVNNYFLLGQNRRYRNMDSVSFLKKMGADLYYWVDLPDPKIKNVIVETYINGRLFRTDENSTWITINYLEDPEY